MADGGTTYDSPSVEEPVNPSVAKDLLDSCILAGGLMFACGLILGFICGCMDSNTDWERQAIIHHAGAYDERTGNFHWLDQNAR